MLVYWGMFILPAALALQESSAIERRKGLGLIGIVAALWVVMAFRETGGDYPTYLKMFELSDGRTLDETISMSDPGYMAVNWISSSLGFGIYGVNALCALIFLAALYKFVQDEPKPNLTLAIAVTYLVIVVAIGYTRQGTAIGLQLLAIGRIRRYRPVSAAVYLTLAASFHATAAIAFPLLYFAIITKTKTTRNIVRICTLFAAMYALYIVVDSRGETFYNNYVVSDHYSSDGAILRSLSNASAGVIFFIFRTKWKEQFDDGRIWLVFAVLALLSVPGAVIASTAVDRMGLYLIPLQLVVFGRLPLLASFDRKMVVAGVLSLYTMSLTIWLHFGQFAGQLWLPYKSMIFGTIS